MREYYPFNDSEHRCDLVWPLHGLTVECDGGQNKAGGGRHGGDADYEKINKLVLHGWRVLRFTGTMLRNNPLGCIMSIEAAINMCSTHQTPLHEGRRPPRQKRKDTKQ